MSNCSTTICGKGYCPLLNNFYTFVRKCWTYWSGSLSWLQILFPCFIAPSGTSITIMNKDGESEYPWLVSDLRGKAFSLSALNRVWALGFVYSSKCKYSLPNWGRVPHFYYSEFLSVGINFCQMFLSVYVRVRSADPSCTMDELHTQTSKFSERAVQGVRQLTTRVVEAPALTHWSAGIYSTHIKWQRLWVNTIRG